MRKPSKTVRSKLGVKLNLSMKQLGLSAKDLARSFGVNHQDLCCWITGRSNIPEPYRSLCRDIVAVTPGLLAKRSKFDWTQ